MREVFSKYKKIILGIGLLVLCVLWYYAIHPLGAKIKIGNHVFSVEVAATEAQKEFGLGNRDALDQNAGMLFPYDHKEQYNFWMRGMRFPLDFIWIDGNSVADLSQNVPPPIANEQPVIVKPSVPVDKVFEVNAGIISKYGIQVGDIVEFINK